MCPCSFELLCSDDGRLYLHDLGIMTADTAQLNDCITKLKSIVSIFKEHNFSLTGLERVITVTEYKNRKKLTKTKAAIQISPPPQLPSISSGDTG
ncbi:MAG: hypothetical protein OEY79_01925 [Anaplasmataceae bacterium]|nr:hypothetical protein [Candidatus Heimdallarchaeota archaeon]MDH5796284.1 hypothetical protein [Anaplasmataceae bacterium]